MTKATKTIAEKLVTLNELRVQAGQTELKSWSKSHAVIDEAIKEAEKALKPKRIGMADYARMLITGTAEGFSEPVVEIQAFEDAMVAKFPNKPIGLTKDAQERRDRTIGYYNYAHRLEDLDHRARAQKKTEAGEAEEAVVQAEVEETQAAHPDVKASNLEKIKAVVAAQKNKETVEA